MAYKDEVYWIERDKIGIATLDRSATSISNEFTGPVAGKTVTLFVVSKDDNFDSTSGSGKIDVDEAPNIPSEFHEALTYKVIADLYARDPRTIQLAQFWDQKFQMAIRDGKKYANTGRDGAAPKIKPAEY